MDQKEQRVTLRDQISPHSPHQTIQDPNQALKMQLHLVIRGRLVALHKGRAQRLR
jgi:hypothetical protein